MASNGRGEMIQNDPLHSSSIQKRSVQSRHQKGKNHSRPGKRSTPVDSPPDDKPADLEALRKARLDYIDIPADERKQKMKYVGETIIREPATKADIQHVHRTSEPKRRRQVNDRTGKRRQHRTRVAESDTSRYQSVYQRHRLEDDVEPRRIDEEDDTDEGDQNGADAKGPSEPTQRTKRRRSKTGGHAQGTSEQSVPVEKRRHTSRRRQSEPIDRTRVVRGNSYDNECQPVSRERNTTMVSSSHTSRQGLRSSTTPLRYKSDAVLATKPSPVRSKTAPSIAGSHARKGPSIFSTLLRSSQATQINLKKATCLACGSDDVPILKTAKLACTHRMCHDCLRRIFTMSVSDPAHMPPKCCTSEHIPLKHVDKLFDQKFKKTWNRKFQEYTTRNRIYCPTRHCGEWIKPNHLSLEHGRKVGKCKRCGTRVCCICNNKMHTSRECPKDPETKVFVEVAQKEGWQRCFNCSAMVELKEGCNHMTCRCTAEFCMICGNKWKTCDCPWFNYEAVEADRLEHMNVGHARGVYNNEEDRRAPIRYQEEMDRRRYQERRDEALARRMQMLGVEDDPSDEVLGNSEPGNVIGIGNAADHFLNHDFRQQARDILTGNFRQAARAAEGLLNGVVTGRENPLPPAPFELNAPAANAANQTAQLLRHDSISSTPANNAGSRRPRRHGNDATNLVTLDAAEAIVPLPAMLPQPARRPTVRNTNQTRVLSGLAGLRAGGFSQTAEERAVEQRIENWRSDVPPGEPAGRVNFV